MFDINLKEFFDYNPKTGVFTNKARSGRHFKSESKMKAWND